MLAINVKLLSGLITILISIIVRYSDKAFVLLLTLLFFLFQQLLNHLLVLFFERIQIEDILRTSSFVSKHCDQLLHSNISF